MTVDLSAFYFDIRKDALYCDPISSVDAQGRAHRDRPAVPRDGDLARADAAVHGRGGMAGAPPVRRRLGASRTLPRRAGGLARRRARREMAQGAHRAPRRHRRARDRARGQAHRLLARGRSVRLRRRTRTCSRRCSTSTWPKSAITSAATLVQGDGPADAFRLDDVTGVRSRCALAQGTQMRAVVENSAQRRHRTRPIRMSRRATPRRCANGTPSAQGGGITPDVLGAPHPPWPRGRARELRVDRPGVEALADLRVRPARPDAGAADPVPRPGPDLEQGHQLRPVPAGWTVRPMGAAGPQGGRRRPAVGLAGPGPGRG